MIQGLKEFWYTVTRQPIHISECTTHKEARNWFARNGLRQARGCKTPAELRELLFEQLMTLPFDYPLNRAIRSYLNALDERADRTVTSGDLEAAMLRAENPVDYEKALREYRRKAK